MLDSLSREPALLVPIIAMLVPIVGIIAFCWYHVRNAELDARLKHDMLERGMSADDIERVLRAGGDSDDEDSTRAVSTAHS